MTVANEKNAQRRLNTTCWL